jgi:hypothetical protein
MSGSGVWQCLWQVSLQVSLQRALRYRLRALTPTRLARAPVMLCMIAMSRPQHQRHEPHSCIAIPA